MNHLTTNQLPLICDLTVFPADVRQQMAATVPELFQAVQEVRELSQGYAFQFPNRPGMFMSLAQFVEHERQCCPFYHFGLEVEPNGGMLWLRMTGSEDVKQFMQTVWNDLSGAVPRQLMKTGSDSNLDAVIFQTAPILVDVMNKAKPLDQG